LAVVAAAVEKEAAAAEKEAAALDDATKKEKPTAAAAKEWVGVAFDYGLRALNQRSQGKEAFLRERRMATTTWMDEEENVDVGRRR
jgi:hypothetical protein